ncbi:hypothetical protein LXL04_026970 [Taraxacum kok-saghyz]
MFFNDCDFTITSRGGRSDRCLDWTGIKTKSRIRFMTKSEQAKTPKHEDGVDTISKMPDHVLLSILSRLPGTEEVIRTSILSTRWRYIWTSVPSIDISCTRKPLYSDLDGFSEFVYWVLLNKPLDLDSFRLFCADYYNMATIRQWIHATVMRKVKLLDLTFCPVDVSEDIQLPHSLVTCDSLEVFKLCVFNSRLCVPNITGFQALRVLHLRGVDLFDDNLVKYFLESSPLLEDLSLINCRAYKLVISSPKLKYLRVDTRVRISDNEFPELGFIWRMCDILEISCPKLEFLELTGYVAFEFLFENLPSLKKAVMHPKDLFIYEKPIYDLFARISHVESLSISVKCIAHCFMKSFGLDSLVSLPNLKTLKVTIDGNNMSALVVFLVRLPNLESLYLIIPKDTYCLEKLRLESSLMMRFLTLHLKKVEFLEFDEEQTLLVLAHVLLEHGKALKEMVFIWSDEAKFHERNGPNLKPLKDASTVDRISPKRGRLLAAIDYAADADWRENRPLFFLRRSAASKLIRFMKESTPKHEDGVDMISNLPNDVLQKILSANSLVISCPKLKNLRIENREAITDVETEDDIMGLKIEICCPKLVFLNLTGSLAYQFSFENLHSLKKAVIHIKDFFDISEPTFDFFDEISHVESLSISHYCVKQCYMPPIDEPISLPNLKTLELTVDVEHDIIPFLTCLPELESLHLIFKKHAKPLLVPEPVLYYYGLDLLNLEDAETINMVTRHLKKVDFLEFDGGKSKLDVARALLEHANLLEEMVYWVDETMFHERSMNTMKEVSNFHKASLAVRITGVLETDSI